jgi:hypothetical protein
MLEKIKVETDRYSEHSEASSAIITLSWERKRTKQ